jgi:uncharacterized protein (TIGR02001 family)
MKKFVLAAAAVAALVPMWASAQSAASPLTGNLTVTSDYRFRGISQSFKQPALQGGIDFNHASGFYLGNWNSSVSGNQYLNGASLEMDFYGGYKAALAKDVTLDVGGLYYYYPGSYYSSVTKKDRYDNFELYVGGTFGPLSAKVSVAVTDFFGQDETTSAATGSTKGSYYLEGNYATEIMPKVTLGAHVGYQNVRNFSDANYVDYKLGLTYDWTGWMLGAAVVGTNADEKIYVAGNQQTTGKELGKAGVVVSIGKSF